VDVIEKKKNIRQELLKKLRSQNKEQRRSKSEKIRGKLYAHEKFKAADTVMFYISEDIEVDTEQMIRDSLKSGKKVAVPITVVSQNKLIASLLVDFDKELSKGPYGILQPKSDFARPVPLKKIDVVIVPGVAFDSKGHRLGHGTGYYDRFLSKIPQSVHTLGLAFDFQMVDSLPVSSHDIAVKEVISN
jgi:5-formyltetrahydrofolate cyclo-ligase